MRAVLIIYIISVFSIACSAETYTIIGDTVFGSDGATYTQIGDTIFTNY